MVEEPLKMKKKDQISVDQQEAIRLQAKFDEKERLAKEKDEASIALTEEWNDIQVKIKANQLLAERLQAREQEELTIEERAKLFQQLLEKRRKFFTAKRAEEKRNKPPTKAQQRSIMTTYLKNIAGWKPKDLKSKSFTNVQELFKKAMKRVNTFVDMDTELVEGSETRAEENSKRAGDELEQENAKKQKVDVEKETKQEKVELQSLMETVSDEEGVAIDSIPLATKPPSISKRYMNFLNMLKDFDREDLETMWKLMKDKHGSTRPKEGYERVLWGDLKTMFELDVEDAVWKMQQMYKVLSWKLFDSCGVHCLTLQSGMIYMLVEKRYPLTPKTITEMLNRNLEADNVLLAS
ncbi:hypothetical protein Tco_1378349 [Tanacetum coccineum]